MIEVKDSARRRRQNRRRGFVMSTADRDYYRQRVAEETSAAERASCEEIRGIHLEMRERYLQRLASLDEAMPAGMPRPRLRAV